MEERLPIDIHYNKLLDWLLSRRHCPPTWQESILKVRQLINSAIQDMPADGSIIEMLQGTYINYFHCKEIVEILKKTEGGSKTIFGSYSSKRLQDWINIIKCYEKDNIYLAEAAQLLTRYVNYEVLSLKKQINKSVQAQQEYLKRESDYHRNSIEMKKQYDNLCKNLGIEGKKLKKELLELLNDLPGFYKEVVEDAKELQSEIDFYLEFINFVPSESSTREECLPMLRYLIGKGNTTVYEWKHGSVPQEVIKGEMDFGDDEDDDLNEKSANVDEIDWGNLDADISGISVVDDNVAEIDWGIEDVVTSDDQVQQVLQIETDRKSIARGKEACSILEFLDSRNLFLDDLHELEAFLDQHSIEMKSESASNFLMSFAFQSAPRSIQFDVDKIDAMLEKVRRLINKFSQPKICELFLICNFPSYVNQLVTNLKKVRSDSEKMEAQSKIMVIRQKEAVDEQCLLEPKLEVMKTKIKFLKKEVENKISQKYQDRKVNIMGEINSI